MKKLSLKLFIIFAFTFLLFLLINTSVFASSSSLEDFKISFSHNGENINVVKYKESLPSNFNELLSNVHSRLIYYSGSSDIYKVIYITNPDISIDITYRYTTSPVYCLVCHDSSSNILTYNCPVGFGFWVYKSPSSGDYVIGNTYFDGHSDDFSIGVGMLPERGDCIVYSSYDVFNLDTGDVFFRNPSVTVGVIPEITQVTEITQVMGEVLKIMIPVGLIIFGIGLLIYLMRLLISRVT